MLAMAEDTTTERLHITVAQLQVGDRLVPTNRVVKWVGRTVKTPGGKRCVILEDGHERDWWKGTTVTVDRERDGEK